MNVLQRLEDAIRGPVERGFARLGRAALQPVDIARQLEQAMEDGQVIESGRTLVPNQYWTFLHPEDYQALESLAETLESDLREHLVTRATARGWALLTPPLVRLNPGQDVRRHGVRVMTQLIAAGPVPEPVDSTRPLATVSVATSSRVTRSGELRSPDGAITYPLAHATVDIGRGRANDIILDETRVSRHHAQIRRRQGRFVIFDLDSANGTLLNGRPIRESVLADGDRVSFGGVELVFRVHES